MMCQDQKENPANSVPMADSAIGRQGIAVHTKMKANNDTHHEALGQVPEETVKESLLPTVSSMWELFTPDLGFNSHPPAVDITANA